VRRQTVSSTAEDYLKAVLRFEDRNEKASTSKVARHLDVTDATVTDMLRKLQAAGLLEYTPYYGVSLTARGREIALKILRRHRLIELFLNQIMGYGWQEVHEEAEKLEHAVSDYFVERIDALLNHPVKDPHGEVIPDTQGFRETENDICLAFAPLGNYTIKKVIDSGPELLTYLEKELLVPMQTITLLEKAPFQGPLKLLRSGSQAPAYIGLDVAKRIFVFPCERTHTFISPSSPSSKVNLTQKTKRTRPFKTKPRRRNTGR
jgi:DtxR family transcriptional regulator, Mn-dependent transcriptional regulator